MKKKLMSICIISMFLLVGCKSDAAYDEAIKLGNEALKNKNYEIALTEFQNAMKEKQDDEVATALYNQSEKYLKASESYEKNQFDDSLALINEVINYENGSDILSEDANNLKKQVEEAKMVDEKINKLTDSALDYFSNKMYSKSIQLIDEALVLINDNENYSTQKKTLTTLKKNCEESKEKLEQEEKQKEEAKKQESQKEESTSNNTTISESSAVSILKSYFKQQLGYAPNTIEVYEVIGNKYHISADNYDDNGMRESFGWWYVDMTTGQVSK